MKFYFHPRADKEFDEAVRYYEDCQTGLGLDFAEEVYAAVGRISEYPDAWSEMSKNTRRCLVNAFPTGWFTRSGPEHCASSPLRIYMGDQATGKAETEQNKHLQFTLARSRH